MSFGYKVLGFGSGGRVSPTYNIDYLIRDDNLEYF